MPTTPHLESFAIIVLHHLQAHKGRAQGISALALEKLTFISPRRQRSAISLLREAGHPVVGTPETGYYLAQNPDELHECCRFLRSRAMHSLVIEARLKQLSLPELLGQISLELPSAEPATQPTH
jgi:hypothetical protein